MQLRRLLGLCLLFPLLAQAENLPTFLFEKTDTPLTIGDIKPSFLVYSEKELPDVSIAYVLKRYQKLFETARSPDVRLDVVNRINNICEKHKLSCNDMSMNLQQQNELIIESASAIMDKGIFYQRMDELLYTWAKALHFMGRKEEAVQRLKMLSGLYPRSSLIDEVRFRMAEAYFDLRKFPEAEAAYKSVVTFNKEEAFHHRANFKLGWAAFRQDRFSDASKYAIKVLDAYPALRGADEPKGLPEEDVAMVNDTLRLLSIMFARQDGAKSIESLHKAIGHRDYAYLLYDGLLRLYLKQDRFEDAATLAATYPVHYGDDFRAWRMAQNAVLAYHKGGFDIKEWQAKEDFVANFGVRSHFWQQRSVEEREILRPHLVGYLEELAHLYYVRMQQAKEKPQIGGLSEKAQRASGYYLELADTQSVPKKNGEYVFLAAEAMYISGMLPEAIPLYERAAFAEPEHKNSAGAGYAAITTYDLVRQNTPGAWSPELANARVATIERFAQSFPDDARTPKLLNVLANEVFELQQYDVALRTAERVLSYPKLPADQRYASSLIYAHSAFALEDFVLAERAYQDVLQQAMAKKDQQVLRERLAASIYKQAESETDASRSAELYLKVVDTVPEATIVAQALYDAAAQQLKAEDWKAAIATLRHFQQAWPKHEFYEDATDKLVHALMQNGEKIAAAEKLVEVAQVTQDNNKAFNALYQAADLYREGEFAHEANSLYERFIKQYPEQFALAVEAHAHVVGFYQDEKQASNLRTWQQNLIDYEAKHAQQRTDRSAFLAAQASYALALEKLQPYQTAKLSLPLKTSLSRKKELLQDAIKSFEHTATYGVTQYLTASTFHIASMYQLMAKDVMASERPAELDALEREQYDILLEEQAFGFEEQAMEIFRINLARGADGIFDEWVRQSFTVMAEMNPAEYARESKRVSHAESYF